MKTASRSRRKGSGLLALVTLSTIALVAASSAIGCADSTADTAAPAPDADVLTPVDAGNDAADDAPVAPDGAVPDVPCAVGNLCRVPTPLTLGSISTLAGRSKTDVWAAGSRGMVMRWDGQAWSALGSSEIPEDIGTYSSLFLTPDHAWGVAGTKIMRRGLEADSVRSFELFEFMLAPTALAVLGSGEAYIGCSAGGFALPGSPGALIKLVDFDTATVELAPYPILPASNTEAPMNIRAMALVPDEALWIVGDRAAVARYPVAPFGPGVVVPMAIQEDLFAAWGDGEGVWVAGENGTIAHYDGADWKMQDTGVTVTLRAIFGFSGSDIWAAGDEGTVLHFDGKTWSRVPIQGYSSALEAIWGASPDDVWIGGERRMFHWGAIR